MKILKNVNSSLDSNLKSLKSEEIDQLCEELREEIISVVSQNGGHLASNLGVVELTVALHKNLDLPKDEIVWDVGHQCYAHKLLTGRQEEFSTLRQSGGISGFPKPMESEADAFVAGHASTSISVALGIAQAAKLNGENKRVVAVIGDGAMGGGMVYEALNHGGDLHTPFTVILNDNEMSIGENVGAMSKYLTRLRTDKAYRKLKDRISAKLLKGHGRAGKSFYDFLAKTRNTIKYFLVRGVFFEEMGFVYLGPVDGHNVAEIEDVLVRASNIPKPTLIHVITKKGLGYEPAEMNPTKFHGASPFHIENGEFKNKGSKSYTSYFTDGILEAAENDEKVVAITAAMPDGTGLKPFMEKYPTRYFDVGIAEQHAVTFAAGMALRGVKPVVAIYSTFMQRAFDQVFHDVALANAPVVFAIDRAGIVGEDGETHQGLFDIAMLRTLPNMMILAPRDGETLKQMLEFALSTNQPVAIRYPRGSANELGYESHLIAGKALVLAEPENAKVGILALGSFVSVALEVAEILKIDGIEVAVCDLQFAKPIDEELLIVWAKKYDKIVVMEDGVKAGGVGAACLEILQDANLQCEVLLKSFPDNFISQGKPAEIFEKYGLTAKQLAADLRK